MTVNDPSMDLAMNLQLCKELLVRDCLSEVEFTAAYIILYSQYMHGEHWLGGRLRTEVFSCNEISFCCHKFHNHDYNVRITDRTLRSRYKLRDIPGIRLSRIDEKRLPVELTITDFFDLFSLKKMPGFVNKCIAHWARGLRPFILRFDIPSPKEVLEMMVKGFRCISVLMSHAEILATYTDEYPPYRTRNALEFLLHDLQHMEQFAGDEFYFEQVGFLQFFAPHFPNLCRYSEFLYDEEFESDLVHLLSDMNSCCVHMLKFLKAKWMGAEARLKKKLSAIQLEDSELHQFVENKFSILKEWFSLHNNEELWVNISNLCFQKECLESKNIIRNFFHVRGVELLRE